MAIEDRNLTVGTRLVASYRKQAVACMVEKRKEGGGILFVLEDGRKFKSASSAASAVMGGAPSTAGASGPSKAPSRRHRKEARSLKRRPLSQRGSSTASRIRRG